MNRTPHVINVKHYFAITAMPVVTRPTQKPLSQPFQYARSLASAAAFRSASICFFSFCVYLVAVRNDFSAIANEPLAVCKACCVLVNSFLACCNKLVSSVDRCSCAVKFCSNSIKFASSICVFFFNAFHCCIGTLMYFCCSDIISAASHEAIKCGAKHQSNDNNVNTIMIIRFFLFISHFLLHSTDIPPHLACAPFLMAIRKSISGTVKNQRTCHLCKRLFLVTAQNNDA